jgi:ABC-type bacteriocin/lantibiotic exporter with double-glycine peptidase domain
VHHGELGGARRELTSGALARVFGTVVGAPLVTTGTVRENLVARLPQADDAAVLEASRAACFDEVVARLPRGYESELEPEGANLSGGERQRLGIAQALLGRPRVLFLDEATCFLDAANESRVLANFLRVGVTVISVAHRPKVIEASQQVFRVEGGKVTRLERAELVGSESKRSHSRSAPRSGRAVASAVPSPSCAG